jgi:CDP-paratose 2-epimerase
MSVALITGSTGLVGSEATRVFAEAGFDVVGIDNDMRRTFFGDAASTAWMQPVLEQRFPNYRHLSIDIRDRGAIERLVEELGHSLAVVIHAAAQPSHDWAALDPHTDFTVNAIGTLVLLESVRKFAPGAVFIFTSTNKVYGDTPNLLPLEERDTRWEIAPSHRYARGIDESMSIDATQHSLFGASKAAADLLVQEYGRYFGMSTVCFRAGCLTGPQHAGAVQHGFLAYLVKCAETGTPYKVIGYLGKQVRDNLHCADLAAAFFEFFQAPRSGEVYNMGGGRANHCSVVEAIQICESKTGRPMTWSYDPEARRGDHIWYVSDVGKFESHYPGWSIRHTLDDIVESIRDRHHHGPSACLVE